jgi:tRNA pseudouridine13 synthase
MKPIKIKVKPEDFIVEEIADVPLIKHAAYGLYRLTKRNHNTVELLRQISLKTGIPFRNCSFGGRKDKYALTTQYVSFKSTENLTLEEKDYSLTRVGYLNRPMGPDLISGNKFQIVVRDLSSEEASSAIREAQRGQQSSFANYFDDQRFGSFYPGVGFLAEKVLKKQYNGALKIYLAHSQPKESALQKAHKKFFFEHWKDWNVCLAHAQGQFEKKAFVFLCKNPTAYLSLLQKIPKEEMSLFFSAYQSYLWNEVLRSVIGICAQKPLRVYKGIAGDYYFYDSIQELYAGYLEAFLLPTASAKAKMPQSFLEGIYKEVLQGQLIKPSMFNMRTLRQAFFKSTLRPAVVRPYEFSCAISNDELYQEKKKILFKFILARGSYATMFLKRVFSAVAT